MRTFKYILVGLVAVAFLIGGVAMFTPLGSDEASGKSYKSKKSEKSRKSRKDRDDDDDDDDDRRAKVRRVKCDKGKSIQKALGKAKPGDVIEVFGDCSENIVIENNRITLRGLGWATLNGPDTTMPTIRVRGLNVTIRDFASISGGSNVIIVHRGASAVIRNNIIENGRRAILVNQSAYAGIEDNIIRNHTTRDAVTVRQSAAADIISNVITGNAERGIRVEDGAAADIEDNEILNNGSDGIRVRRTSAIRFRGPPNLIQGNGGRGIRCQTNSSIDSNTFQNFGTGNTRENTRIESGCILTGML